MKDLIYLDCETTGLNPDLHEIWEIAYAINDGPIEQRIVEHSLQTADPKALALNHYWERAPWGMHPEMNHNFDMEIKQVVEDNTLVCANPPFDRGFLRARWGVEPWHYRSIDLESMALVVLGHERPKGLKDISDELRKLGYNIAVPDHSAVMDVAVLRECYIALRDIMKGTWKRS
jgi:DNA polymerase III alpha subunit (gram-positive type)